jgi:hypothetical protein
MGTHPIFNDLQANSKNVGLAILQFIPSSGSGKKEKRGSLRIYEILPKHFSNLLRVIS